MGGGAEARSEKGERGRAEMEVEWVKMRVEKLGLMVGREERSALDAIGEIKESIG